MKKLGLTTIALGMILGLTAGSSLAQTKTHKRNINQRQTRQERRIEEGVENGSLTPKETYRLEKQEARIADLEAKDRATGGGLSPQERAELNRLLNSESHRIYVAKHNKQGKDLGLYNINKREENQQDRIAQGINSGQLTPREAARLEQQEARIEQLEAKDRASGGKLTRKERAELERLLNTESGRIYRQKHDSQTQPH